MKQIVCLSHSPWSVRPNRTQQLLTRMSDTQVLFFEPPGRPRNAEIQDGLRVRSNITVYPMPPFLPGGMEQGLLRRSNQRRMSRHIEKIMAKHRFRESVLWCTTPENCFMVDQHAYRGLVYDCHQEWDQFPLEWESDLAFAADVVFAASPGLARRLSPCSDNIALLPNGANPMMFLRDDKLDQMLAEQRAMSDGPEREALVKEIQKYQRANAFMIPLINKEQVMGIRSNVKGFKPTPAASHFYHMVYFE